jgi:uracil-DNA glycosylase
MSQIIGTICRIALYIAKSIGSARRRANEMIMADPTEIPVRARKGKGAQAPVLPLEPQPDEIPASISDSRREAAGCTRCDLYRHATQTVFGEGPENADIMFVGEQPGDKEDLQGRPFVGTGRSTI